MIIFISCACGLVNLLTAVRPYEPTCKKQDSSADQYSMAFTLRPSLLATLLVYLLFVTTALSAPTLLSPGSVSVDQDWAGELDLLPAMLKHESRELVKRHEWAMICGLYVQGSTKGPLSGPEDLELSRKCLGPPYKYTCNNSTCAKGTCLRVRILTLF